MAAETEAYKSKQLDWNDPEIRFVLVLMAEEGADHVAAVGGFKTTSDAAGDFLDWLGRTETKFNGLALIMSSADDAEINDRVAEYKNSGNPHYSRGNPRVAAWWTPEENTLPS